MSDREFDQFLDALSYQCPMPLLKTKQAIRHMKSGEVLKVIASDKGSVRDFKAFISHSDHEMLEMFEQNDQFFYYIKK